MQTVAEVRAWLASYSYHGWTLQAREPHLSRNRGCGLVLRMASRSLPDSTDPSRVTTFDMECPVALPISEADAARLLWSLVQFTALHEAAEFLRRDDRPVFDPHDPALEPVIYGTPTIWWSEADA